MPVLGMSVLGVGVTPGGVVISVGSAPKDVSNEYHVQSCGCIQEALTVVIHDDASRHVPCHRYCCVANKQM